MSDVTKSASIVGIAKAILDFQGRVDGVKRTSDNPFFKSRYADLEAVVDTARPHLQACGIAFLQSPGTIRDGNMAVTTLLMHAETGEWIEGTGEIPLGKKDPQGAGSAQTYAQRYHLMAMLGLPPTDDDGEGAIDRNNQRPVPERSSEPRVAANPVVGNIGGGGTPTSSGTRLREDDEGAARINARINSDLGNATSMDELTAAWKENYADLKKLPEKWELDLTTVKNNLKAKLDLPK